MIKKSASTIKQFINIPQWVDWNRVRLFTFYMARGIKSFVIPHKKVKPASFEATIKRYQLTETDLELKQKAFLQLSLLMLGCAGLLLLYSGYQFFYGSLPATLLSLVVMGIALVLAFRYHFWYFQVKRRQLGCSIQDWFTTIIRRNK